MELPLISIITVTFQAQSLIHDTVISVSEQSYPHIQHVLVDGGSKDQTVEMARLIIRPNHIIISERDHGLYDAMNKGLAICNGEYVLFLNAGDKFHRPDVLASMFALQPGADCYYGPTTIIDEKGQFIAMRRHTPPKNLHWKSFTMGMCVSHQSILMRKKHAVNFDLQYKIAADIDWSIRSLKNISTTAFCNFPISDFMVGGVSSNRRWQGLKERFKIMIAHYGLPITIWSHVKIAVRFGIQKIRGRSMD
jgi:glycosyltransferase involved in cell wall biosynthesis